MTIAFVVVTIPVLDAQPRSMVASSLAFMTHPFGTEDPYSWAFGGGLIYERKFLVGLPVVLGGRATYYDSRTEDEAYGASGMFTLGVYAGVPWQWHLDAETLIVLTPVLGLTEYWRRFEHLGGDYTASRPIVSVGAVGDMYVGPRILFGVAVELGLILDRQPVVAINQSLRLGYRF